ncbi:MAG: hypothetical protein IIB99_02240, partial [Planctomycetes bacterium]|nr:hypothetical protein [Planctomycetota bacterium]
GDGADSIQGGDGDDIISGGDGDDTIILDIGDTAVSRTRFGGRFFQCGRPQWR